MSEIVQDLTAPGLAVAIEANFAEEMAVFGRYLPGAELHDDPEILWFITGLPFSTFNGVLRTRFITGTTGTAGAAGPPGDIDAKIDAILSHFQARRLSMDWPVSPATRPANLATRLEAHGLTYLGDSTTMVLDMLAINEDLPTHPGLTIQEVHDLETLKLWRHISDQGFESSDRYAKIYYNAYINMGLGPHLPWHHYIGWLNHQPVATSSLLLYAGVAGIYGVSTIPYARRQGIGAAMTLAPLRHARSLGYHVAILSPSKLGLGVYRRIGFQEHSKTKFYQKSINENRYPQLTLT